MIGKIVGKIMSYCGLAVMIIESIRGDCQICRSLFGTPCFFVLAIGAVLLIGGCIIHELDEK